MSATFPNPSSTASFVSSDHKDFSVPTLMKTAMAEQGFTQFQTLATEKTLIRTVDSVVSDKTESYHKQLQHKLEIYASGMTSDIDKPYQAIGTPVLDTADLIVQTLNLKYDVQRRIVPEILKRGSSANVLAETTHRENVWNPKLPEESKSSTGYSDIIKVLRNSEKVLNRVKNGMSFEAASRKPELRAKKTKLPALEGAGRMAFTDDGGRTFEDNRHSIYSSLLGDSIVSIPMGSLPAVQIKVTSSQIMSLADINITPVVEPVLKTAVRFEQDIESVLDSALEAALKQDQPRARKQSVVASHMNTSLNSLPVIMESDKICERLNALHNEFYKTRLDATVDIQKDLGRFEQESRRTNMLKQTAANKILATSKAEKMMGEDFMAAVRREAVIMERKERAKVFEDLLASMVDKSAIQDFHPRMVKHGGGIKGVDTSLPSTLHAEKKRHDDIVVSVLRKLRWFYESNIPFGKAEFYKLCETNPPQDVSNPIFRFLKDTIVVMSEREYLEVMLRYAVREKQQTKKVEKSRNKITATLSM